MEEKIKDLERLIEKYKHTIDGLKIEKILQESYFIKSEEEFYKVWEEYKDKKEQEEWTNYNKNLIWKEANNMEELVIDKVFKTRQEMEAFEEELSKKYIIFMIMRKDQVIGEPEVYGIDKIIHFGLR